MKKLAVSRLGAALALLVAAPFVANAQTPTVIMPVQVDISPPLTELSMRALASTILWKERALTGFLQPQVAPDPDVDTEAVLSAIPFVHTAAIPHVHVQTTDVARPRAAATTGVNFDGIGVGLGTYSPCCAPPDTVGAPGLTQYVQVVNTDMAVFTKTGALVVGPFPTSALWAGFGGLCETTNQGDAIVLYDRLADRWLISQFAFNVNIVGDPVAPFVQCIAVSTSSDATGTYARYGYSFGTELNDYPKIGVWPDAYYFSFNIFQAPTFSNTGIKPCAADRAKMLIADPTAVMLCFATGTYAGGNFGMLPTDLDGLTPPPLGTPNFFIRQRTTTPRSLGMNKFHVDFVTPANSTFTAVPNIPVGSLERACGGGACIPQPGTAQVLDSLGDRLMHRLAYRNFGTREALVVTQSVTPPAPSTAASGVRWFEVRDPNGASPVVFQKATYAPDNTSRWMASAAMDKLGNMLIGYSVSSSAVFPGIRYTGRLRGEPRNLMQAEAVIVNGGGSQINTFQRWGDYSSMNVDPADDCTFWYTTEYIKATGSFNWSTRIAAIKFPNCQ